MADIVEIVETLNLADPVTMTALRDSVQPKPSLLCDTLLSVAPQDIVKTDDILVDVKDLQGNELAPFVAQGHKSSERKWYKTVHITPARIAPQRPITLNDISKRAWLEQVANPQTQEERAVAMLRDDMTDLTNRVRNTWELMIADLIQTGKYTYTNVKSDADGQDEDESANTVDWTETLGGGTEILTTVGDTWDKENADPLADLEEIVRKLVRLGVAPSLLIMGSNAAHHFERNQKIREILDNRRMEYGNLSPVPVEQGGARYGTLNVVGYPLQLIEYNAVYVNAEGETKPFIDPDKVVLTSPAAIRGFFAGVTQIDQDKLRFSTYLQSMVPKFKADDAKDVYTIKLTSRPVFAPRTRGVFHCATVLASD